MPEAVRSYGLVISKDSQIREALLPITADDRKLSPRGSVTYMFPGACNQDYSFGGSLTTQSTTHDPVKVTCTDLYPETNPHEIPYSEFSGFSWDGRTKSKAGEVINVVFGEKKAVCRIVRDEISEAIPADYAGKTEPDQRQDNKIEYLFSSVKQAWDFVKKYKTSFANDDDHGFTTYSAKIEMFEDYMWTAPDNMAIDPYYDITLATAPANDGVNYYKGSDGRALISRDLANPGSFFDVGAGSIVVGEGEDAKTEVGTFLTIEDLRFDGKSVQGSSDGGAVKTRDCQVTLRNTEFKNFVAGNGGAVYVE